MNAEIPDNSESIGYQNHECQMILNDIPTPVLILKDEKIVFVNHASIRLFKARSPDDMLNANISDNQVEVFVETGLVQLSRKQNRKEKILINPGNVGVLNTKKLINVKNDDQNIISWKTKEIIFREDNLEKVIKTLNKVYKTNIECENQDLLKLRYTSTFRNQNIDAILNVICLTFNLKIENRNDQIYLVKHDS